MTELITAPADTTGRRIDVAKVRAALGWRVRRHELSLTLICLVAALTGQYLVDGRDSFKVAGGLFLMASLLFVGLYHSREPETKDAWLRKPAPRPRWSYVAGAGVLGTLAFPRFTGNIFHPDATMLWVGGFVLLALGATLGQPGVPCVSPDATSRPAARSDSVTKDLGRQGILVSWRHVALLGIMLIGGFFRLFRIDQIPLEMGPDLPHIYSNIRYILRREFLIFFPSHPGREGLFFYVAAPLCRLFGLLFVNIKVASALVGIGTLPVLYLLGRELYDREVALYAAFFLSISHWHVILTRVGFRAATMPLLIALVLYFLVRGLKTQRLWFYALSGFFLGLGLYSYNAFMIAPLMVVAVLATSFLLGRGRRVLLNWQSAVLLVIVAVYVFIPLAKYATEEPEMYAYRAATRITSVESSVPENVWKTLSVTLRKSALMFNYQGDGAYIANVPFMRELGFFSGTLFVLGLALLVVRWRSGFNLTVLVSLSVMILPSALAVAFPNEVPNAIRAIGALPLAVMIPAVALAVIRRRVSSVAASVSARERRLAFSVGGQPIWALRWRSGLSTGRVLLLLAAALMGYEAWSLFPTYFEKYVSHLPDNNYSITLEMARAIDEFADDGEAYIKTMPYWYDGNAVRAQLRRADQNWHNEIVALRGGQPPLAGIPGKFVVIVHPDDESSLRTLETAFPRGIALTRRDGSGRVAFITFYGER